MEINSKHMNAVALGDSISVQYVRRSQEGVKRILVGPPDLVLSRSDLLGRNGLLVYHE